MLRWVTFVLALAGVAVGVAAVFASKTKEPQLPLSRSPSVSPFDRGVAALGIVEPAGRDVSVVAPEQRLVTKVLAEVGESVEPGQALLELDARTIDADLLRANAAVEAARAEIARWHALPRKEDLPPLEATLARARAALEDREEQLRLTEQTASRGANTERDVSIARFARDAARADFDNAKANLDRAKAGGWKPDLDLATAALNQRLAEVEALRVLRERMVVRAPRAGKILRRSVEPGEIASVNVERPAFVLGDLRKLHVRAQIDEEDIALLASRGGNDAPRARAVGRTRGAVVRDVPLKLVRIEPFARPKSDLSGTNIERVDTRVIDAVFEVESVPEESPLFPGQAVDVFVEAGAG
jgi:multidrug efflux pump subunit AcrA (membrane-fusion protein)